MIGRQQVGEPEPICLHHLLSGLKLIVCPLDELHVSRQQVALRTQSYNLITVENVSTNVPLQLSNGPLVPGASRDCQLPLQLAIADLVIDIRLTGA